MNDEKLALDEKTKKILIDAVLKFGKLSIPYLMRKLKCSEDMAKTLISEFEAT